MRSDLMSPKEAAAYLGCQESTLAVWRCTRRQQIPYLKLAGKVRYRRLDLDEFIDRSAVGVVAESAE